MKIAIINRHLIDVLGGSELQCDTIARHLTEFGHECVYLAMSGAADHYDVPYSVLPVRNASFVALYRLLKSVRPDIVYWRHNKKYLLSCAIASKLAGARFVYAISSLGDSRIWTYSGQIPQRVLWSSESVRKLGVVRWGWRCAAQTVSSFRGAYNYLALPVLVDGVVSLNSEYLAGIPVSKKVAIHNSMEAACVDFSWEKPYVVWVSNLKEGKDPESFRQLAARLTTLDVDFLMIGALKQAHFAYLTKPGDHPPNFHYLGAKTPHEVNGVLRGALFLVHTCYQEGFGNNFIQAWLQGKPTVSLRFDPEGMIEREGLGRLSRTFSRLVSDTEELILDPELRAQMGMKSREVAGRLFDAARNVRLLEQFLLGVA